MGEAEAGRRTRKRNARPAAEFVCIDNPPPTGTRVMRNAIPIVVSALLVANSPAVAQIGRVTCTGILVEVDM
jgi:hypothetical protein